MKKIREDNLAVINNLLVYFSAMLRSMTQIFMNSYDFPNCLDTNGEIAELYVNRHIKYPFQNLAEEETKRDQQGIPLEYSYSLVVPAYNEEKRILPFMKQLSTMLPSNWEVIIVCDGTDKTAKIAREADYKFKVMEFEHRLGKGGAILEGFKAANGDVVGYADADGAISVHEVKKVFSHISGDCDVAVGSRWVKNSNVIVRQPLLRVILGRLYHYAAFAILGIPTKDTQCGVKAFKKSTLQKVLPHLTLKNLSFDTAILYHCKKLGSRIAEVPITWNDVDGSKVRPLKTAMVMFSSLVGIRLAHSNKHRKLSGLLESIRMLLEKA